MTSEAVLGAVAKYEALLSRYEPKRHDIKALAPAPEEVLSHARWMCGQVREFVAVGRMEKAFRWLGFIQGALWSLGRGSIDDFREDNLAGSVEG